MNDKLVMKFGGSSLGDISKIKVVAKYAAEMSKGWKNLAIIVSAMGDDTDDLLALAGQIGHKSQDREMDFLLAGGEGKSAALLAMAICNLGVKARSLTGAQAGIVTTDKHGSAKIMYIKHEDLFEKYPGEILVIAGFQGISEKGELTTLGRGGSDASAVALAVALKAKCQIYTDVDGIYVVNPRVVERAKRFNVISYAHMIKMGKNGAGVMMPRSVEIGMLHDLPITVLCSPSIGTSNGGTTIIKIKPQTIEILDEDDGMTALAIKDVTGINIIGVDNAFGTASEIFSQIKDLNIIDSAQNLSVDPKTTISVVADRSLGTIIAEQLSAWAESKGIKIVLIDKLVAITLVDDNMPDTNGYFARITSALASSRINIIGNFSADNAITVIVDEKDRDAAAKCLAEEFDLVI